MELQQKQTYRLSFSPLQLAIIAALIIISFFFFKGCGNSNLHPVADNSKVIEKAIIKALDSVANVRRGTIDSFKVVVKSRDLQIADLTTQLNKKKELIPAKEKQVTAKLKDTTTPKAEIVPAFNDYVSERNDKDFICDSIRSLQSIQLSTKDSVNHQLELVNDETHKAVSGLLANSKALVDENKNLASKIKGKNRAIVAWKVIGVAVGVAVAYLMK